MDLVRFHEVEHPADVCTEILNVAPICKDKMTVLPGLEPTVFAILTMIAVAATIMFWVVVFVPRAWPRART